MKNSKLPGKKGGPEHQAIEKILRTKVIPILRRRGYPHAAIIFYEKMFEVKLGYSGKKGSQNPDAIIFQRFVPYEEYNGIAPQNEMILIEIGKYEPSKWPLHSVIHIGFRREITKIFKSNSDFELQTLKAISEVLAPDIDYALEDLSISDMRLLSLLSLIGVGLTSSQLEKITIGNLHIENESISLIIGNEELYFEPNSGEIIKKYLELRKINGEVLNEQTQLLGKKRKGKNDTIGLRILQRDLKNKFEEFY